jgi:hypothetical protein
MLCAGVHRREGWKTLDASETYGADFIAKIPPLPQAVKTTKWEEIEWIHGIGALYPWQAQEVLIEIKNALASGGKLVLEQTDIGRCWNVEWIFGDPTLRDPLHMNHWGYTPFSLRILLFKVGFNRIELRPAEHHRPDRDFRIEAYA